MQRVGIILLIVLLNIKIVYSQEVPLIPPEEVKEPLVTNTFVRTDIKEALLDISEQVGIPIIPDESVYGEVTLDLKDVPLEKALSMMLVVSGLIYKKMDGYYLISTGKPNVPTFPYISEVEYIKPKYLRAEEIKNLLSDFYTDYITFDQVKNLLIVTAPAQIIKKIKEDIEKIDKPQRQIVIEVVITEVSSEIAHELGISWDLTDFVFRFEEKKGGKIETRIGGKATPVITGRYELLARLLPYVREGKVRLRATPRITTSDGKEAFIEITQSEYYEVTAERIARLETISTGISLRIRPFISKEGVITMDIEPQISTQLAQRGAGGLPIVGKRRINTEVSVKDGETIAIGGLLHTSEEKGISRIIPFLSKIPPLSWLLGRHSSAKSTKELVIFVTPYLLPVE